MAETCSYDGETIEAAEIQVTKIQKKNSVLKITYPHLYILLSTLPLKLEKYSVIFPFNISVALFVYVKY